jgi:hypothetical protein
MVTSAVEPYAQGMVVVGAAPGAIPAAACLRGALDVPSRSEPMTRGAVCGNPAGPDLWEAGGSDLPGPPGTREKLTRRVKPLQRRTLEKVEVWELAAV